MKHFPPPGLVSAWAASGALQPCSVDQPLAHRKARTPPHGSVAGVGRPALHGLSDDERAQALYLLHSRGHGAALSPRAFAALPEVQAVLKQKRLWEAKKMQ